jgi:hypothetical protein
VDLFDVWLPLCFGGGGLYPGINFLYCSGTIRAIDCIKSPIPFFPAPAPGGMDNVPITKDIIITIVHKSTTNKKRRDMNKAIRTSNNDKKNNKNRINKNNNKK